VLSLRAIELKWLCRQNAVSRVAADVILGHAGLGNLQRFFDPLFSEVQGGGVFFIHPVVVVVLLSKMF
jgi:hypothetical protein